MKKMLCYLLTVSLLLSFSMNIYANTLPQTPVAGAKAETEAVQDPAVQVEFKFVDVPNAPDGKAESASSRESKNAKSTELVEVIQDGLEEYNPDTFSENFDEGFTFSKMQLAKDIAMYMVKSFVYDLKSFVTFYPLIKTSSIITLCAWAFPLFFLYKKTGINIPGKYANFAAKHDNWHIFFMNLYNVIPMTLTSFMIKYGQEVYSRFKT